MWDGLNYKDEHHCPKSHCSCWGTCWCSTNFTWGQLVESCKATWKYSSDLGAEKALFRALKTKYGIIYHASLIGQATPKHNGKISWSLAAKTALIIRYDALADSQDNTMGFDNRAKLEASLRALEGKELGKLAGSAKGKPRLKFMTRILRKGARGLITPAKAYNPSANNVIGRTETEKKMNVDEQPPQTEEAGEEAPVAEGEKKKFAETEDNAAATNGAEPEGTGKKEKKHTDNNLESVEAGQSKKKKRKHADAAADETETTGKKKEKEEEN